MFARHNFKRAHEEFIADNGKSEEHVEDAEEHGNGYTGGNGGESGTDGFCRFIRFLEGTGQHVHGVLFGGGRPAVDVIVDGAYGDEEDEGTGTKDGAEGVLFAMDAVDTKGLLGFISCTLLHHVDGGGPLR